MKPNTITVNSSKQSYLARNIKIHITRKKPVFTINFDTFHLRPRLSRASPLPISLRPQAIKLTSAGKYSENN